jgi:heptaprenylglyceryl phosphate synthase
LLSSVTATSVDVSWSDNSDGGSPITAHQIGWGTSSSAPTSTVSASSPQVVTGLTPGTTYYIFVRAQNSVGWSAWSKPTSMRTVAGAYILVGAVYKLAVPYVRVSGVWKQAEAWTRSAGVWKRTT